MRSRATTRPAPRTTASAQGSERPSYEVPDVFGAADREDPTAVQVLEGVALDLALGISAVADVLDPELVVLGGGIGSQPLLAERA